MAPTLPSRILLFGATGIMGKVVIDSLLQAKPPFSHISVFTSASSAKTKADLLKKWETAGVVVVIGDMTNAEDVISAYKSSGADTVISCVARVAIPKQIELIRLAEESGTVQWFYPSEYGTDVEYGPESATEEAHRTKLAVRRYARENVKRVRVTYLVTGPWFDMFAFHLLGLEMGGASNLNVANSEKRALMIGDGQQKIGFCTMQDAGKCMILALRHPQPPERILRVQSFVASPKEILAEFERQTGDKWEVTSTPIEKVKEVEAEWWAKEHPNAYAATLRRIWAEGGTLYEKNDNDEIGLKPEDMDSLAIGVRQFLDQEDPSVNAPPTAKIE